MAENKQLPQDVMDNIENCGIEYANELKRNNAHASFEQIFNMGGEVGYNLRNEEVKELNRKWQSDKKSALRYLKVLHHYGVKNESDLEAIEALVDDNKIYDLSEQLQQKEKEIAELKTQLSDKQHTIDVLKTIEAEQDAIIGRLTRENENLKDTEEKRGQWIDNAKKEAGYSHYESFDNVWKDTLQRLKAKDKRI